jgi:hypothetical protein
MLLLKTCRCLLKKRWLRLPMLRLPPLLLLQKALLRLQQPLLLPAIPLHKMLPLRLVQLKRPRLLAQKRQPLLLKRRCNNAFHWQTAVRRPRHTTNEAGVFGNGCARFHFWVMAFRVMSFWVMAG